MNHGEEVASQLVVAGRDPAEVLQFGEEALDQVALAIEPLAEAGLPAPIALGRDVWSCAPILDQVADAISVIGLIGQHDSARTEVIEQVIGDLPIMRLACCQAKPDGKGFRSSFLKRNDG